MEEEKIHATFKVCIFQHFQSIVNIKKEKIAMRSTGEKEREKKRGKKSFSQGVNINR